MTDFYRTVLISNLDVVGDEDRKDSFFNKVYEAIVGAAGVVLKNQKEEQIATKVPIEGEFGDTTVGTWYAIVEVLRNAFIQALYPTIDNEITILSVEKAVKEEEKGFFKKLFRKSDPKNN